MNKSNVFKDILILLLVLLWKLVYYYMLTGHCNAIVLATVLSAFLPYRGVHRSGRDIRLDSD
jgi:hypothetical protein